MRYRRFLLLLFFVLICLFLSSKPASADTGITPANLVPSTNELPNNSPQSSIQAVAWYDGLNQYSSITNCVSIIQGKPYSEKGMETYVGFRADPETANPAPGQVYYVHLVIFGMGNSCAGQRAFIDIQLPPSTSLAISPSNPVYCYAGGSPLFPASDCPQNLPVSPLNPGALAFYSTDAAHNYTWPVPQGAVWEFQIPLVSSTTLSGSLFKANVLAMDGNASPWLRPEIGIFVFSNTPVIIYPSPSTEFIQQADLSFQYKSQAYVYTLNQTGTVYFDLGTSPGVYSLKADAIPLPNPGTAWHTWDDWVEPSFTLLPNTTYHWRVRFVSSGGQTYSGSNQTFTTLTTGIVTLGGGTPASCNATSLNAALNTAGLKELVFDCGPSPLSITMSMTRGITNIVTINGGNLITLVAPSNSRHFDLSGGAQLTLDDITLSNGNATSGCGGAVRVAGNSALITNRVRFLNNHSQTDGGAVCVDAGSQAHLYSSLLSQNSAANHGGAVFSAGSLEVLWTDISKNTAGGNGGGVAHDAPFAGVWLDVRRSLVAENTASGPVSKGGGLYVNGNVDVSTSTLTLNNSAQGAGIYALNSTPYVESSTVVNNTSSGGYSGLFASGAASFSLRGSIIAFNLPANCTAGQISSLGYNLENANQCALNGIGDLTNVNPKLDTLRFNGGGSRTILLKTGSPAIDAGNPNGCGQYDQRGFYGTIIDVFWREADGNGDGIARCDIGAFERLPSDVQINDIFLPFIKR